MIHAVEGRKTSQAYLHVAMTEADYERVLCVHEHSKDLVGPHGGEPNRPAFGFC